MITRTQKIRQKIDWRISLANTVREVPVLLTRLGLIAEQLDAIFQNEHFPLRVPEAFLRRMKYGDPHDPLLRQVLLSAKENQIVSGFVSEPLMESRDQPVPGVIHKYAGRVLLPVTGACAIHCRYCFRQHFPYAENALSRSRMNVVLEYLQKNTTIREVILSGGDPLSLSDDRIAEIIVALEKISHIKKLRFHTRFPIVIPERITPKLIQLFSKTRLPIVVVLHVNHANELDKDVKESLWYLKSNVHTLLNQAVLLRGVNDTVESLTQLSETLFDCGVLPYYLHLLDKVKGTQHFEVNESDAKKIMNELLKQLPGYLVPKLVREIPGELSKVRVN